MSKKFELKVTVVEAHELKKADLLGLSDPYVALRILTIQPMKEGVQKTKAILKTLAPQWNEGPFVFHPPMPRDDKLEVKVYDHNAISTDELIGQVEIAVAAVAATGRMDDWWDLHSPSNKAMKGKGAVHLILEFTEDGHPPTPPGGAPLPPQQPMMAHPPPGQQVMYAPPPPQQWQQQQQPMCAPPPPPQMGYAPPPPTAPVYAAPQQMAADPRPPCKYGASCYRKNPDHLRNYYHPQSH
jgi:hypothetical protein